MSASLYFPCQLAYILYWLILFVLMGHKAATSFWHLSLSLATVCDSHHARPIPLGGTQVPQSDKKLFLACLVSSFLMVSISKKPWRFGQGTFQAQGQAVGGGETWFHGQCCGRQFLHASLCWISYLAKRCGIFSFGIHCGKNLPCSYWTWLLTSTKCHI